MSKSIAEQVESTFVETLALVVKEGAVPGNRAGRPEYKTGWLEGYAKAWEQLTGHTAYSLFTRVNEVLRGSGYELEEGRR